MCLVEDLQQQIDVLRIQVSRQETSRVEESHTCIVGFDDESVGLECETSRDHFICSKCDPQEV